MKLEHKDVLLGLNLGGKTGLLSSLREGTVIRRFLALFASG
jgi:hypothetical protein